MGKVYLNGREEERYPSDWEMVEARQKKRFWKSVTECLLCILLGLLLGSTFFAEKLIPFIR